MSGSEHRVKHRTRGIDLNADLGEGCPNDRLLLERVMSASVCCGAMWGDPGNHPANVTERLGVRRGPGRHSWATRLLRFRPPRNARSPPRRSSS